MQVSAVLEAWMEKHPEEYIEVLVNNAGVRRDNLMMFMPEKIGTVCWYRFGWILQRDATFAATDVST